MAKRDEWEYLVLSYPGGREADNESRLNGLGSQGWELVAVGVQHTAHVVYLKRRKWA